MRPLRSLVLSSPQSKISERLETTLKFQSTNILNIKVIISIKTNKVFKKCLKYVIVGTVGISNKRIRNIIKTRNNGILMLTKI